MQRLEALLHEIGWKPRDLADEIAETMGYSGEEPYKAVIRWFDRDTSRRLNLLAVRVVCETIGVDPAYLLAMTEDLEASASPRGRLDQALRAKAPPAEPKQGRSQPKRPSRPRRSA